MSDIELIATICSLIFIFCTFLFVYELLWKKCIAMEYGMGMIMGLAGFIFTVEKLM